MGLEVGNTEVEDEDYKLMDKDYELEDEDIELEGMDDTERGSVKSGAEDIDSEDEHEYDPAAVEKLLGLTLPSPRSDMLVTASPASTLLTRIRAILDSDPSAQIASPSWEPLSDEEQEE